MNEIKLSVLTKITIIFTVLGMVPVIYINILSKGYLPPAVYDFLFIFSGLLFCALGFIFGICGLFGKLKWGNIICLICVFLNFILLKMVHESSCRMACASNIKNIKFALQQYAADYSGYFPPESGAAGLEYLRKYDYLADYSAYTCPSAKTETVNGKQPLTEQTVNYVYVGGLNIKSDPNAPILYDKPGNHQDFGNVCTVDGTVKGTYGKNWMERFKK